MKLPAGTVTFLFTDIEGSTRLLQELGDQYAELLSGCREILRSAATSHGGQEIDSPGDACFFAFPRVSDAVAAAVDAQRALGTRMWPEGKTARPRMGIHTGEPMAREGDYVGIDVHRAARICNAAHGGQILISDATRIVLEQVLPKGVTLKLLGEHRLKDLLRPERLFQVVHPDLPESFPPLRTLDAHPNNLPLQPTAFIGREAELMRTRTALLKEGARLLTLTGAGGIGKTRLALQLAAEVIDQFHHGAFFVPLAHITDPHMIVPSIAKVLGVNETPGRTLLHNLQEYLHDKQTLLALDNLEQVIEAASVIDQLLAACPELKIVATSRERLRLSWEREFPVPMLEIPERRKDTLDIVSRNPAVALFVNRCRFVQPEFALTPANVEAVATICIRLEGLPLAIELAAARIKILTPEEIARRLDDQSHLLRGAPRDAPQRHQSLQAAISWSYELLTPDEQRLFRSLAVFRGGFALESAEAVGSGNKLDVLDGLTSLVDKSLLRRTIVPDGSTRFLMLETIREYGVEQLVAAGEIDAARTRHANYFASLAEQMEPSLASAQTEVWFQRLWRDTENLRSALDWSLRSSGSISAQLGSGLGWLFYVHGHLTEGRARIEQILRAPGGGVDDLLRARVLLPAGVLAWSLGEWHQASAWLEQSLGVFRQHSDARREAMATAFIGHVARSRGEFEEASKYYQTALAIYRSLGNEWGIAWALFDLGTAARDQNSNDEAAALHEQSLALFRKLGYRWGSAWALWNLGILAHRRGDDDRARELLAESLALYRALDDRRGIAQSLEGLAAVAFVAGRLPEAVRVLSAAAALRAGLGAPIALADRREYDRVLEGVKASMASSEFEREWSTGRSLEPDDAIQLALDAAQPPIPRARLIEKPKSPLTPREHEVAALISRGLSNREIAAKLSVAERTAISHVEHIMNKLGLHSRAQIAAWAVRHGFDLPADS
jgi:predicted ATPase/class 3 adenylate cyclase/DNA-binding CsgD family transcriptional regulator